MCSSFGMQVTSGTLFGLSAKVSRAAYPSPKPVGKSLSTGKLQLYAAYSAHEDKSLDLVFTSLVDCVTDMNYAIYDGGQITLTSTQIDKPICDSASIDMTISGAETRLSYAFLVGLSSASAIAQTNWSAGDTATAKNEYASFSLTPGGTGRNVVFSVTGTDKTSCKVAYKV